MQVIENEFQYEVDNNKCIVTKLLHPEYFLKIPDYVRGKPVREIGKRAFSGCRDIATVILPSTLTHIRENAFTSSDVSEVKRQTDKNSPTLYVEHSAFYECVKLSTVEFGGRTFLENTGRQFKGCTNLRRIDSLSIQGAIPVEAFVYCDIRLFCFNDGAYVSREAFKGTPLEKIYVKGLFKFYSDFLVNREDMEIVCEKNSTAVELAYSGYNVKIKE